MELLPIEVQEPDPEEVTGPRAYSPSQTNAQILPSPLESINPGRHEPNQNKIQSN